MSPLRIITALLSAFVITADAPPLRGTLQAAGAADPYLEGAPRAGGRFRNPDGTSSGGPLSYVWYTYLSRAERLEHPTASREVPTITPALNSRHEKPPAVTWLGQSTVLIQYRGINALTDPMLSTYAGPVRVPATRRHGLPVVRAEDLPEIDLVLISHDHYDHLDLPTLAALPGDPLFVVPLRVGALVRKARSDARVVTLDWWQSHRSELRGESILVRALPARHTSGRSPFDRNYRLWASFLLVIDTVSVLFIGDTGFSETMYAEIGRRARPTDLALLPIGSYLPRAHMAAVHTDPTEAVRVHELVGARCSIGIHWGSFEFGDEPLLQPVADLAKASHLAGLRKDAFGVFAMGETRQLAIPRDASCWRSGDVGRSALAYPPRPQLPAPP